MGESQVDLQSGSAQEALQKNGNSLDWKHEWREKQVHQWTCDDIVDWLSDVCMKKELYNGEIKMIQFKNLTGDHLLKMGLSEFCRLEPKYGHLLHEEIQSLLFEYQNDVCINTVMSADNIPPSVFMQENLPYEHDLPQDTLNMLDTSFATLMEEDICQQPLPEVVNSLYSVLQEVLSSGPNEEHLSGATDMINQSFTLEENQLQDGESASDLECCSIPSVGSTTDSQELQKEPQKRGRGRPRKNPERKKTNEEPKVRYLWEFLLALLEKPENFFHVVKWENRESGVFRIVNSQLAAQLWGKHKKNDGMTWEKLGRAIRQNYAKEVLSPGPKDGHYPKKLVYKFGPAVWIEGVGPKLEATRGRISNSITEYKVLDSSAGERDLF